MTTLRFGLGIFTGQLTGARPASEEYQDILVLAELAERCQFDSVWVSEHHFAADSYLPSLLPMLAAIAARTSRIQLGTATVLAPFHHPLRLAEDCAVVDELSSGRLILGLALGWRQEEFRAFGIPVSERVGRLEETIEVLRRAWSGERFTFHGRHFHFERVRVTPRPQRRIPIWLGGAAGPALRRAARLGDGFIASKTTVDGFRVLFSNTLGFLDADRRMSFSFAAMVDAWVGDPSPEVLAGIWQKTETYRLWREGQDAPNVPLALPIVHPVPPDPFLTGDPARLAEQLRPYLDLGPVPVTLIVRLQYPGVGRAAVARGVEQFAAEVVPLLRGSPL